MEKNRFTSSYTRMFLAFHGSPELLNLAKQSSTANEKKLLSAEQIQEARQHPSAIMNQALKVFAVIQGSIKTSQDKLDAIEKQRSNIESLLIQLKTLANNSKNDSKDDSEDDSEDDKDDSEDKKNKVIVVDQKNALHQQLVLLREAKYKLESTVTQLEKERVDVDKILPQHKAEWIKHQEEYFGKLIAQLEANGVTLTTEEKAELRRASNNDSSIQEKISTLEKLQIKLPNEASYFAVLAYDAVVSALSRNLQKVDNKTVGNVIKNLSVIKDENMAAGKLKSDQTKQYEKIINTVKQLDESAIQVKVPSPDILNKIKQKVATSTLSAAKIKPAND